MATRSDARLISVGLPFDREDFRGVDYFWAVKPPSDTYEYPKEGRTGSFDFPYRIMGSPEVTVDNKETIQGLRALLDAIEKDMDE